MMSQAAIKVLLMFNDRAVEKAILAIHSRQTDDEQNSRTTLHSNGIGFKANHAKKGAYYAGWIQSGRSLSGWHLTNARNIVLQYSRQLHEIAMAKELVKREALAEARNDARYGRGNWG